MIVPAVAVNVTVVPLTPTATVAGTLNPAALLDRATVAPPMLDTVAVHVDDPPVLNDAGAQVSAVRVGGGGAAAVTTPPTPVTVRVAAPAVAPKAFVTLIIVLVTLDAIVTLTTAATPFCITVSLRPNSTQT